jgi:chaperonin GroES
MRVLTLTPSGLSARHRDDARTLQAANRGSAELLKLTAKERAEVSVSIKPLEDRIVVRPLQAEQTTASGLVIPDTAKEKPQEGEVVAVGAGRFDDKGNRIPVDVAEGDVVLYSKYGGTEVKFGGEEYLVLSARDVLAIVTK